MSFDREVEQYLCAAVRRPGSAQAPDGTLGGLCRLLALLRAAFPRARFLVRLDGGFASPEVFDFLDAEPRLDYVVAMAKNAVLLRLPSPSWWRPAPRCSASTIFAGSRQPFLPAQLVGEVNAVHGVHRGSWSAGTPRPGWAARPITAI